MTFLSQLEKNIARARELKPECIWAAEMFLMECDRYGFKIRVAEAYRPQERQDALYAQGRTSPGPIVTWTRSSKHTKRIAMDIYCINCTYADIIPIALSYGIRRDPALVKLGDLGHFNLDAAKQRPIPSIPKSANAARRRLERAIRVAPEPKASRLKTRLHAV